MTIPAIGRQLLRFLVIAVLTQAASMLRAQVPSQSAPASSTRCRIDLPTALRLANAQNLDVQIARQRLNEARANQASAVYQFLPWLSPGAAFRRHENRIQAVDGTMLDADKQSYAIGLTATAQVDLGEAIYKTLSARQLVKASEHGVEAQRQESVLSAAQGYFNLLKSKASMEVVQESLNISQEYQRQIHDAVGAGIAFRGDELRVQTQTERYEMTLRQSREQQRAAAAALAQVLHLDPSVELVPQDSDLVPLTLIETNAPLAALVQQALRSRPELKHSQALVRAAHDARNGTVYGPLIPTVGAQIFGGGLGGGKGRSTGNFGESEDYFVGLGWRIGPGGLFDFGRVNASKARFESAKLSGEKLIDEITRQVVDNHTRVLSLADQIATAKQNLITATESLRLTRERKQFGVGVVLEDIQVQQELTRARSDYLNAIAEFNKAQYGLNKAIGTLAEADIPDPNKREGRDP